MRADQFGLGNLRVALILAVAGAAVGEEMLGGGGDMEQAEGLAGLQAALQALDHCGGIGFHQRGIGGIAFIAAAPAQVLRHGERRGEGPFDARPGDFRRRRPADAADEIGIMGRAKADIVREDGGARHIAVPVHGVHAEEDGDARPGLERGGAIVLDQLRPGGRIRAFVAIGAAIAAREDGAEWIAGKVGGRHGTDVALHHLADLLFDGHAGKQGGDRLFGRGVGDGGRAARCGPGGGMGAGGRRDGRRLLRGRGAGERQRAGEEHGGVAHGHPS